MKEQYKLPAVLGITLFMMLGETAGAFFGKSISLLSHAGMLLACGLSFIPYAVSLQETASKEEKAFKNSNYALAFLNSSVLTLVALFIIYKSILRFSYTNANAALTALSSFAGFIGIFICLLIIIPLIRNSKEYKILFLKYAFIAAASFFVIICNALAYVKDIFYADSLLAIVFALLICLQSFATIKKSMKNLREKI